MATPLPFTKNWNFVPAPAFLQASNPVPETSRLAATVTVFQCLTAAQRVAQMLRFSPNVSYTSEVQVPLGNLRAVYKAMIAGTAGPDYDGTGVAIPSPDLASLLLLANYWVGQLNSGLQAIPQSFIESLPQTLNQNQTNRVLLVYSPSVAVLMQAQNAVAGTLTVIENIIAGVN